MIISSSTAEEYTPQEEVVPHGTSLEHQTHRELAKTVLGLFDRELANNGQVWHMDDMIAKLPELDEAVVRETVMRLMEGGLLMEAAPAQYRKVA